MSYLTAPSVVLTDSACVPCGPGGPGSLNGSAVALTGSEMAVVAGAVAAGGAPGWVGVTAEAGPGSGDELLKMTVAGSPSWPLMTNMAGCCLVAPPTGTIATARCRPGARCTGGPWSAGEAGAGGRAAAVGAETRRTMPPSVPFSEARIGRYCPAGHHAQAAATSSAAPAVATAIRRTGCPT